MQTSFKILKNDLGPLNPITHLVCRGDRPLGGYGTNHYRSWVFPLYTPAGRTVLDAFPFDHPFHNGIFVGQHPVRQGERIANFWVMPPRRLPVGQDPINVHVGRMDAVGEPVGVVNAESVRFQLKSVWRDEHEQPFLDEERIVEFTASDEATICDVTSRKLATYGALVFPQAKHGAIGARIEPRLLPVMGGAVVGDDWQRGSANRFAGKESDFIAYDNGQFGVCLIIRDAATRPDSSSAADHGRARGPWFTRDYGMAMYNPTHAQTINVPAGGDWTIRLRVVAYDGMITRERVRAWRDQA